MYLGVHACVAIYIDVNVCYKFGDAHVPLVNGLGGSTRAVLGGYPLIQLDGL